MKRKEHKPITDLDVGSFSDISFLLIIFFILTTQIVAFNGFDLDIPSGAPANETAKEEDRQITVSLTDGGKTMQLSAAKDESVPVDLTELKNRLTLENFAAKPPEKRVVILDAASDVPYDVFFKTVMVIRSCGGVLSLIDTGAATDGKAEGGAS